MQHDLLHDAVLASDMFAPHGFGSNQLEHFGSSTPKCPAGAHDARFPRVPRAAGTEVINERKDLPRDSIG